MSQLVSLDGKTTIRSQPRTKVTITVHHLPGSGSQAGGQVFKILDAEIDGPEAMWQSVLLGAIKQTMDLLRKLTAA